jgi:hypothetical protein
VDPTEVHQVGMGEVAGDDAVGLRRQELSSGRAAPVGSGVCAGGGQDRPDRGRSDLMAESCELALDPATAPAWIFFGRPRRQLFDGLRSRWSARPVAALAGVPFVDECLAGAEGIAEGAVTDTGPAGDFFQGHLETALLEELGGGCPPPPAETALTRAAAGSAAPSPAKPTGRTTASSVDRVADGRRSPTRTTANSGTRSSAGSTASRGTAPSPRDTTSRRSATRRPSSSLPSTGGCDQHFHGRPMRL